MYILTMVGTLEKNAHFSASSFEKAQAFFHIIHTVQYIEQLLKGQCHELFTPDFFYNSMPRGKVFLSFDFAKIF